MDAITSVAFDISAAAAQPASVAATPGASAATVFDVAHFDAAYATVARTPATSGIPKSPSPTPAALTK